MADREFSSYTGERARMDPNRNVAGGRQSSNDQQSPWKQLFYRVRECQYTLNKDELQVLSECQKSTIRYYLEGAVGGGLAALAATRKRELGQRFGFMLMASYAGVVIASRFVEQPCMSALLALEDSPLRGEMMAILQERFPEHPALKQELRRQEEGKGKGYAMYDETGKRTYPRLQRREEVSRATSREAIIIHALPSTSGSPLSSAAPLDRLQGGTGGGYASTNVKEHEDSVLVTRGGGIGYNNPWEGPWQSGKTGHSGNQSSSNPWRRVSEGGSTTISGSNRQEEAEIPVNVSDGWKEEVQQAHETSHDSSQYHGTDASETLGSSHALRHHGKRVLRDKHGDKDVQRGGDEQINNSDHRSDPLAFLYGDVNSAVYGEVGRTSQRKLMTREERRRTYFAEERRSAYSVRNERDLGHRDRDQVKEEGGD